MTTLSDKPKRTRREAGPASMGSALVGVSGARRNPAAATAVNGQLLAFCEQERLSRIRGNGVHSGEFPREAIAAVIGLAGIEASEVTAYVTGEEGVQVPAGLPRLRLDHHQCHAATAFLTSPFDNAAVLVCDSASRPEVSVWHGRGSEVVSAHWPWAGQGFASLFSQASGIFGFAESQAHKLEALARLDHGDETERVMRLIAYRDDELCVDPDWKRVIADWLRERGPWSYQHGAHVAASFQNAIGSALLELTAQIRRRLGVTHLCLGGGLFYNTFLNTLVARSGQFDDVFVPPNPGNAGIAAGAALTVGRKQSTGTPRPAVSAFLGPEYQSEEIKQTLDNCKLSYEYLREDEIIDACVRDLTAGRIVGWFQGRMEWGHRALGNRSILASPFSPYVLDNLNGFLKQREPYRAYGLSVCEEDHARYFDGPVRSQWMEYDYQMKDPEAFRHVIPSGASTLRVQTVDRPATLFRKLHHSFAAAAGIGVLVNTSFNGFAEPIVCSPRDAIRVFYGTGLDALVIGRFLIRK
jgi:carbamoyltransferase